MQYFVTSIIIIFALTLQVQASQYAQGKSTSQRPAAHQFDAEPGLSFSPAERNLIRSQLLNTRVHKTEGSIGRTIDLPSDWQDSVTVGRSLDYHIYQQGKRLPESLLQKLSLPARGSEILLVGDKVIWIDAANRTILDAFNLVPTR